MTTTPVILHQGLATPAAPDRFYPIHGPECVGCQDAIVFQRQAAAPRSALALAAIAETAYQPPPTPNDHPAIQDLVTADIAIRKAQGIAKYGTALQPFNGRDALVDGYQEALDLVQYLRQAIYERDGR